MLLIIVLIVLLVMLAGPVRGRINNDSLVQVLCLLLLVGLLVVVLRALGVV